MYFISLIPGAAHPAQPPEPEGSRDLGAAAPQERGPNAQTQGSPAHTYNTLHVHSPY